MEIDLHGLASVQNHDNIVKLYDSRETEKEYQMFMEYCDRPTYFSDKILEVRILNF